MHNRPRFASGFGLLYGLIGLLLVTPMAMMDGVSFGSYPHSVGLDARITPPPTLVADVEGRILLTIRCSKAGSRVANEPELQLNSRIVSRDNLRRALKAELSRRGNRVVYVNGEGCLNVGDVVGVIDIARDAWYGVPIVLLTPEQLPQR